VFLDSVRGNPRTGIVDAVLLRVTPREPDVVQVRLVQLKSGSAGLKAIECERLEAAVSSIRVSSMAALCSGTHVTTFIHPRVWEVPVVRARRNGARLCAAT
jgi:hypothetical protein